MVALAYHLFCFVHQYFLGDVRFCRVMGPTWDNRERCHITYCVIRYRESRFNS